MFMRKTALETFKLSYVTALKMLCKFTDFLRQLAPHWLYYTILAVKGQEEKPTKNAAEIFARVRILRIYAREKTA